MVLGKLRPSGPPSEHVDLPPVGTDGSPATFTELLAANRHAFGAKVVFQQKERGEWRRYSHDDVDAASRDVAAGLIALGLKPGERVALVMENGWDWVRSYFGIVLARGIAVPIYYDLRPGEIATMAAHADPRFAICNAKTLPKLTDSAHLVEAIIVAGADAPLVEGVGTLTLDALAATATPASRATLAASPAEPDDIASIVFTSGTSGGAKGVMLTHRNFMANKRACARAIPLNDRDRLVVALPMHHAFPFIVGMVIAPAIGGEVTFENDLRRIRDRMAEVKPTLFQGVPALFEVMYRNILHSIEVQGRMESFQKGLRIVEATKQRTGINIGRIVFRELHKRLGGSLRFMLSGGAALNPQVARDFALLGVPVLQGWGLSEASPVLSVQRWHPRRFYMSNYYEDRIGSIGLPLDGVEIALIDVPEKELYVHLHGEGEIIARGENITPGYWRSPEETEKIKLGEWLRTGDIGRVDEEGNLWITGRSKFVIVLDSGEKVHPDELEERFERSPLVEDVMVMGRKLRGKTHPAALVYPNRDEVMKRLGEGATAGDVLRAFEAEGDRVQQDVAAYKRATEIVLTDEPLPRTPIRKVMRGQVKDSYSFDLDRWSQTWSALQSGLTAAPGEDEAEEPEAELATA